MALSVDKQELCGLSSTPLVSVVIPAYNHECWIAETLKSVLNQTLTDFELIVVDDGSKDKTAEIVSRFQDERLKLVRQENRGTAAAVNRGLDLSRGRYIAILNSDDLFRPERLAVLVELLEENSEKLIAFSRVSLIDAEGAELADDAPERVWLRTAESDYGESGDLLLSLLRDNFVCTSSNFFFRRCLLAEIGHFRDLRYVNDLDFLVRALTHGSGLFCGRELLAYRQHGDNTLSERKLDKEADFILEVAWVLASAFVEGRLARQWDFQILCELLVGYYCLNLETLLFSILCLSSQDKIFTAPGELTSDRFTALIKSARRQLDEKSYVETLLKAKTFHLEQSQIWQKQSKIFQLQSKNFQLQSERFQLQSEQLQTQNQIFLEKMRVRDLELAQAERLQHDIWQNREWYRQQFEAVVNSRRFRFFTILNKIRRGEEVKANLRELLRLSLPDLWRERLRVWRSRVHNLRDLDNLKATLKERYKSSCRRFFARHHFEQKVWSKTDSPLLSLLVFCRGDKLKIDAFLQQLQEQTWAEFEVRFLITESKSRLKQYIESRLRAEKLTKYSVMSVDSLHKTRAGLFNRALKLSQGKYIAVLDCYDVLSPTFFEESLLKLEAAPPHFFLQVCNSNFPAVGENGSSNGNSLEILDKDLYRALILRQSAAAELGGFNETVADWFLEWEFYVNLVRHGYKGCTLDERVFCRLPEESRPAKEIKLNSAVGREQIRSLHLGALLNNRRKLERRAGQFWEVKGVLSNFPQLSPDVRETVVWLDLQEGNFVPWEILPRLQEWTEFSRLPLIVTLSKHFKAFFLYNRISPEVRVYFPEDYHLQGKKDYFCSYLERRYSLQKIFPAEFLTRYVSNTAGQGESSSGQKKMRILYASPWLITGGADTMTVDWFRELDGEWCEKYFMTTLSSENNWLVKIVDCADGIFDLPSLGCSGLADLTAFLVAFIARQRIDIVHIMNSELTFNALPELKKHFPQLKVVAQFHCFDYFSDGRRTGYPMTMPPRYDHLIDSYNLEYPQLGEEIMELYPYISPKKFQVIHGSVNSDLYDPQRPDFIEEIVGKRRRGVLNLLFIGRLDRQKQPLRLLETAVALRRAGVAFIMHIIGDGSLESQKAEFLRKLKDYRLQDEVCWYGEQPLESLAAWYKVADILLLTSDWEGVPMVLYQAMAMEVVPVVADVGGCAELVTPDCGCLIADRENPVSYVDAIRALIDNQKRREMAKNARKRMLEEFSLADLDEKYRDYYRSLIS